MSNSLKQMAYDTIEAHQETIADLHTQLEKANESYKELFSAFESCQGELKESNERESVLSCQLDSHMERVAELEKENKRESMELRSRLGSALGRNSEYNSAIENMQQKLAKANERVAELEQNQLPVENGKNRYGLDVSYFRNTINRELNRPLSNHKPDELARVLARLSRTADKSVMFEAEFSYKFAIEKKIEAVIFYGEKLKEIGFSGVDSYTDQVKEMLRKEQE